MDKAKAPTRTAHEEGLQMSREWAVVILVILLVAMAMIACGGFAEINPESATATAEVLKSALTAVMEQ